MIVANLGVLGAISFERLFTRCVEGCSVVHLAVMYFGTKIRGVIVRGGYGQQINSCFKLAGNDRLWSVRASSFELRIRSESTVVEIKSLIYNSPDSSRPLKHNCSMSPDANATRRGRPQPAVGQSPHHC